jgi:hypothetical protein
LPIDINATTILQQGEVKASPPTAPKESGARIAYEIIRLEPRHGE